MKPWLELFSQVVQLMNKFNYHETFTKFVTVDCGPPPVVVNEVVSYQTTILRGHAGAQYCCDDCFILEGEMTAVCKADGRWNPIPVCR